MNIPPPTEHRRVTIFEGPAGSGKSYLMKQVAQTQAAQACLNLLPDIDRPRSYPGELGLWHAQMKDYRSSLHMLMNHQKVALVDRWLVSQQIYDSLRYSGRANLDTEALAFALMTGAYAIKSTWAEHYSRINLPAPVLNIDMLFVVITTPSVVTNRLRVEQIENGRVYPYEAAEETKYYRQAAFALAQLAFEPITLPGFVVKLEVLNIFGPAIDTRLELTMKAMQEFFGRDNFSALP